MCQKRVRFSPFVSLPPQHSLGPQSQPAFSPTLVVPPPKVYPCSLSHSVDTTEIVVLLNARAYDTPIHRSLPRSRRINPDLIFQVGGEAMKFFIWGFLVGPLLTKSLLKSPDAFTFERPPFPERSDRVFFNMELRILLSKFNPEDESRSIVAWAPFDGNNLMDVGMLFYTDDGSSLIGVRLEKCPSGALIHYQRL